MRAAIGDKLVIKGHHLGEPERIGIVREVHGHDGEPPWVIEWTDRPGEHVFFPGSDAIIEHFDDDAHRPASTDERL